MENQLFQLKFTAKQLQRMATKSVKEENAALEKYFAPAQRKFLNLTDDLFDNMKIVGEGLGLAVHPLFLKKPDMAKWNKVP